MRNFTRQSTSWKAIARAAHCLVALWLSSSCAHGSLYSTVDGSDVFRADISLSRGQPARVRLIIPRGFLPPGQTAVLARFPDADGRYVGSLREHTRNGGWREFEVNRTISGFDDIEIVYDVPIPTAPGGASRGRVSESFELSNGYHLALTTILPQFSSIHGAHLRRPGVVTFHSDQAERLAASVPHEGMTCVVDDWTMLQSAFVDVGSHTELVSSFGTHFISNDFSASALQRLADLEARAEPVMRDALGSRQRLNYVYVFKAQIPEAEVWVAGLHAATAIIVHAADEISDNPYAQTSETFLHELMHAHLPPSVNVPMWIVEGVTNYLTARVVVQLAGDSELQLRAAIQKAWLTYERIAAMSSSSRERVTPYHAGMVLGYCVDVRLRRESATLAQVLARANARAGGYMIENDLWEQEIALASAAAGATVLRSKTEAVESPASCFREEGHDPFMPVSREELARVRARLPDYALSFGSSMFGITIIPKRVAPSLLPHLLPLEPFKENDIILSVAGKRVDTERDLVDAVMPVPSSMPLPVVVLRAGELVQLQVMPP